MNIKSYKDKDGKTKYKFFVYIGTDVVTGKRKRTNRQGFNTRHEAKLEYLKLIEESKLISNKVSFLEVYKKWWNIYKLTVKESTQKTTSDMFRLHILPYFENSKIEELGYEEVQAFTIKKSKEYKKYKEIISYLSLIFKHAIRLGIIKSNPCDLIIYPKTEKREYIAPIWTVEDIKNFLKFARKELNSMWYIYFYLLIITGARRGEILALHWSDIQDDVITISRTTTRGVKSQIVDSPKTFKSKRSIVIDEEAVNLLKKWKTEQAKFFGVQNIVFTNSSGGYITQTFPIKKLQAIVEKYNLPYMTLHGLRHTRTTLLDIAGTRSKVISDILGHTNSKMTDKYNHSNLEEQRKIIGDIFT